MSFMDLFINLIFSLILTAPIFILVKLNIIAKYYRYLLNDFKYLKFVLRVLYFELTTKLRYNSIFDCYDTFVKTRPNDVSFVGIDGNSYTYKEFDDKANAIGTYFESIGFEPGQCVALLMESIPEYIMCWYGLGKMRFITAFINTYTTSQHIQHCLVQTKCSAIIFDETHEDKLKNLDLSSYALFSLNHNSQIPNSRSLFDAIKDMSIYKLKSRATWAGKSFYNLDTLCYIFTSGTTGLPKAALIKHSRFLLMIVANLAHGMCSTDTFYTFLPLYHANSGLIAVGGTLAFGNKLVIRKKFSLSHFIDDCCKYKINKFNYIGEICRYLCNLDEQRCKNLNIDSVIGNGIRKDVWRKFKNKLNIKHIYEFYGSTEGNIASINLCNIEGACGYMPRLFEKIFVFSLLRCENDGTLILNNNKPVYCQPYQLGHIVGMIKLPFKMVKFNGYLDKSDNSKKILTNLFRGGDAYFMSGDLLYVDNDGFLYFYDRIGDTYRWKAENISTTEIENFFNNFSDIDECCCYGVMVTGYEGRAGMIAIKPHRVLDMSAFYQYTLQLPTFQRPLFIRIMDNIPKTQTFKFLKKQLMDDSFDPSHIKDPLFYLEPHTGYQVLTQDIYIKIQNSQINF